MRFWGLWIPEEAYRLRPVAPTLLEEPTLLQLSPQAQTLLAQPQKPGAHYLTQPHLTSLAECSPGSSGDPSFSSLRAPYTLLPTARVCDS